MRKKHVVSIVLIAYWRFCAGLNGCDVRQILICQDTAVSLPVIGYFSDWGNINLPQIMLILATA